MTRTIGNKFNSIGDREQQEANLALVRKLLPEIDMVDGISMADAMFIDDTRRKLAQSGNVMFGWRQVEAVVRIHRQVKEARCQPEK